MCDCRMSIYSCQWIKESVDIHVKICTINMNLIQSSQRMDKKNSDHLVQPDMVSELILGIQHKLFYH